MERVLLIMCVNALMVGLVIAVIKVCIYCTKNKVILIIIIQCFVPQHVLVVLAFQTTPVCVILVGQDGGAG